MEQDMAIIGREIYPVKVGIGRTKCLLDVHGKSATLDFKQNQKINVSVFVDRPPGNAAVPSV
jgi:hypothetical protein